jgi:hypothetical protein
MSAIDEGSPERTVDAYDVALRTRIDAEAAAERAAATLGREMHFLVEQGIVVLPSRCEHAWGLARAYEEALDAAANAAVELRSAELAASDTVGRLP